MSSSSEWSSTSYTTTGHNLSYSIRRRQRWFRAEHGSRCTLVSLTIADGSPLRIPCCDRRDFPEMGKYVDRHATAVTRELCRRFPNIPRRYTEEIARALMGVVVAEAAIAHRCPLPQRSCPVLSPEISTGLGVVLGINTQDLARAIRDSFEEARPRPATADSVQKLLAAKHADECEKGDWYGRGWSELDDHDCVICTEELARHGMLPRVSRALPGSVARDQPRLPALPLQDALQRLMHPSQEDRSLQSSNLECMNASF